MLEHTGLWQHAQLQENDAPPSARLRAGKGSNENSMATPFLSKQTGKQQSQTAARKALSNISNINHLESRLQGKAQQNRAQQGKQGTLVDRSLQQQAVDEATNNIDNKMDVLAEQYSRDGIEQTAGLSWEAHEDVLLRTSRDQAAARAATIADIVSGTAMLRIGGRTKVCCVGEQRERWRICGWWYTNPIAHTAAGAAPGHGAPSTIALRVWTVYRCVTGCAISAAVIAMHPHTPKTDAEMVDILFPTSQPDNSIPLHDLLPSLDDMLPSLSASQHGTPASQQHSTHGSPAFSVEEDCNVCFEWESSPALTASPPPGEALC